jgi:hypothetical protein
MCSEIDSNYEVEEGKYSCDDSHYLYEIGGDYGIGCKWIDGYCYDKSSCDVNTKQQCDEDNSCFWNRFYLLMNIFIIIN